MLQKFISCTTSKLTRKKVLFALAGFFGLLFYQVYYAIETYDVNNLNLTFSNEFSWESLKIKIKSLTRVNFLNENAIISPYSTSTLISSNNMQATAAFEQIVSNVTKSLPSMPDVTKNIYKHQFKASLQINSSEAPPKWDTFSNASSSADRFLFNSSVLPNSSIANSITTTFSSTLCPLIPPGLIGSIAVYKSKPSLTELETIYPALFPGGHWKPVDCISRHRVAIVVPYRNRPEQLQMFLHNMHDFLRKQQLDYAIYIIEPLLDQIFNRAKLMNIGYAQAIKDYDWQCFVFHDVDLYPENDRNIYSCPEQPRHMSVAIDKFAYKLPYELLFGGITAMTKRHFASVNGYSNSFWGWGGEDDEMSSRVRLAGYNISRYPQDIARYQMFKHAHENTNPVNPCRIKLMYKVKSRWKHDGLNNLEYKVVKKEFKHLYTWVQVDLLENQSREKLAAEKICA